MVFYDNCSPVPVEKTAKGVKSAFSGIFICEKCGYCNETLIINMSKKPI